MSLQATGLSKVFGNPETRVLKNITLSIDRGEFVALTGRSGSGKSTLLYLLSGLDRPSAGTVQIEGMDLSKLPQSELARFRNQHMGFCFQFHYLISELPALENVLLPTRKYGHQAERLETAKRLLECVGLQDKLHRLPRELSGGEQQRVAIARSLVMEPQYLFADEPTGSLDSENAALVMGMLKLANQETKTTVILVTHDPEFARSASRQIVLSDGQLI